MSNIQIKRIHDEFTQELTYEDSERKYNSRYDLLSGDLKCVEISDKGLYELHEDLRFA